MDDVVRNYPFLSHVTPALTALVPQVAPMQAAAGMVLFDAGAPCQGFPLVLEGEVQVARHSDDGRSLELYRLAPGDLCLVSSACLFGKQPLSARAVATQPTRLLLIPPHLFTAWLDAPAFRDAVLALFAERMTDLTMLVDAVAFRRLDQRLAAALLGHGPVLQTTHQRLADELGTVREMVTRLLRRFEREGWVTLAREQIRIADSAALRRHSGM